MEVGAKIREVRIKLGLSIRQLADKVGVSYLTMQRIETDKISPSVALLAQISACLSYPLTSFLSKKRQPVVHIRAQDQNAIKTKRMLLRLVAPKGVMAENVSVVYGKAEKGRLVGRHKHPGFELAFVVKGRALHRHAAGEHEVGEGDLIFFDASQWHEVIALEPHEWLGMTFYSETINLGETDKTAPEPGQ